ncbi:hypothetical protein [Apibacter sp. B3935]|uniref:hypothetical protein n=1 Tax=Apibacter sp. B3935 TaxID=2656773 RepID=UPI002106428B|nr:hypothetical protein [Apibacter sp. B3935]
MGSSTIFSLETCFALTTISSSLFALRWMIILVESPMGTFPYPKMVVLPSGNSSRFTWCVLPYSR